MDMRRLNALPDSTISLATLSVNIDRSFLVSILTLSKYSKKGVILPLAIPPVFNKYGLAFVRYFNRHKYQSKSFPFKGFSLPNGLSFMLIQQKYKINYEL